MFAIYSTEESTPTILYEVKGKNAKVELSILKRALEVIENERSVIEKQRIIDELLSSNWVQEEYNLANNDDRLGERGSDTGYASVLQRESSEFIGSQAFRNVIKNLFDIQATRESSAGDGLRDGDNRLGNSGLSNGYNKQSDNGKSEVKNSSLKDEINSLPTEDKEIVLAARQRAVYATSIVTMRESSLTYDET